MKKILVIGAHYDDFEIGCGGTIYKHIQDGDQVHIAITSSDEHRTGIQDERYREQTHSCIFLGISKNMIYKFSYKENSIHNIVGELDNIHPDIIFTHYEKDTHQDHRRASLIGQAVGRKKGITTLFYNSGSSYDFNPNVYSIIDWKVKSILLNCYISQLKNRSLDEYIVKKKNEYWGLLIQDNICPHAEAFVVRKMKWVL